VVTGSNIVNLTMRATVYPPPGKEFPHVAIVFHTDGTILLARAFPTEEKAHQYIADVSGSLVAISVADNEPSAHQAEIDAESNPAPAIG
jgi:hypothetical protein